MTKDELQLVLDALQDQYSVNRLPAITAIRKALAAPQGEPAAWREAVVVNLVREGVNKHRARELADHFSTIYPAPAPLSESEIERIAKESGASTYRNRTMPERPFQTFSPEQLAVFAAAIERHVRGTK
jgi:hypothetical protein